MVMELDSDAREPEIDSRQKPGKNADKEIGGKEKGCWIENGAERHLDRRWGQSREITFYYFVYRTSSILLPKWFVMMIIYFDFLFLTLYLIQQFQALPIQQQIKLSKIWTNGVQLSE